VEFVASAERRGVNVGSLIVAVPLLAAVAACGDDDEAGTPADLSDEARRGAELVDSNGCTACHRSGGAATSFDGLAAGGSAAPAGAPTPASSPGVGPRSPTPGRHGSTVELDDRMSVVDDDEVAAVVAYLRELDSATEVTNASG
jgi:mono/diheme cytochrome c family protein